MKTLLTLMVLICTTSCGVTLFFGARVVGPYYRHFKGKIECAYVDGWHTKRTCLCWIIEPGFSNNKTFLVSENDIFCEQQVDP